MINKKLLKRLSCCRGEIDGNRIGDGEQDEWGQAFDLWSEIFDTRNVSFKFKEWVKDSKKLDGSLAIEDVSKSIKIINKS